MIQLRNAVPNDAREISSLILNLARSSIVDNYESASKTFWESISETAEKRYIEDSRYKYIVAVDNDKLLGCVAVRDKKHLVHLFVHREAQGKGLASKLWHEIKSQLELAGYKGGYTVNSSLEAVKIYKHFGFKPVGQVKQENGISFQPMVM